MIKIFDIEVDEELVSFVDNEVLVDLNLDKTEYCSYRSRGLFADLVFQG